MRSCGLAENVTKCYRNLKRWRRRGQGMWFKHKINKDLLCDRAWPVECSYLARVFKQMALTQGG